MNLLLIGPPGSGKGTQGRRLAERLGLEHIAAGDLLRAEVAAGTPVGQQVAALMQRGELVPDETIIALLLPRARRAAAAHGYLLDGFPRSVEQARKAGEKLTDAELPTVVVYLDVPHDELRRRILARAAVEGRADDNGETIENRLKVFADQTHPLVDYFRERGLLHVVDADRGPEEVTEAILRALHQQGHA